MSDATAPRLRSPFSGYADYPFGANRLSSSAAGAGIRFPFHPVLRTHEHREATDPACHLEATLA
jgi:hypothetical protein